MTTLDKILNDFLLASQILAGLGPLAGPQAAAYSALAAKILAALQAGVSAHEAITGTPLDLSKLHEIQPLP